MTHLSVHVQDTRLQATATGKAKLAVYPTTLSLWLGAMGKKEGATASKEQAPDKSLLSDVKAFAAQLGLAGGPGGNHAFEDFAPAAASKKINASQKSQKSSLGQGPKTPPGAHSAGQKKGGDFEAGRAPWGGRGQFGGRDGGRDGGRGGRGRDSGGRGRDFGGRGGRGREAWRDPKRQRLDGDRQGQNGDRQAQNGEWQGQNSGGMSAGQDAAIRSRTWNSGVGPRPGGNTRNGFCWT